MKPTEFLVWDHKGNVAFTDVDLLESERKSSNVSLHIVYSATAVYDVANAKWVKCRLPITMSQYASPNDYLVAAFGVSSFICTIENFRTVVPKAEIVTSEGGKIVGLLSGDEFYVGPVRIAKKAKTSTQPVAEPAAAEAQAA